MKATTQVSVAICILIGILIICACSEDDNNSGGDSDRLNGGDPDSDEYLDSDIMFENSKDADMETSEVDNYNVEIEIEAEAEADLEPVAHGRAVLAERIPEECPLLPPPMEIPPDKPQDWDCYVMSGGCAKHEECNEKKYGFCWHNEGMSEPCECYYHLCLTDEECETGKACLCHGIEFHTATCRASCRSSSECAEGQKCVVSNLSWDCSGYILEEIFGNDYLGEFGYRCTSTADECDSDYDCAENYYCVFEKTKQHFACVYLDPADMYSDCD